ncbi:lipopolysaccharide biosynthesis protein [Tolypothrix sp. FACHB-123]|uniref:lipopolysaccharide biosynthesis protein n=1 Tax=Tolypothrix sp. FACHB-123 TaxID=2692868 RepID=UPI001689F95F|nr:lipopolysaccharide biosynthesis protein [Tolypothrix sp. FACHB-123]MBD2355813.1 lipopolysaccharide biosynthesis protein [Tolypothrix sp. FACHB-123]
MKNISSSDKNIKYFRTDHLKADLKSRSVRGGAFTMIAQIFKFSLNLVSNTVLARLLTPQDYGLIGMVTTVTGFVLLFKDLGLSMATVQKEEINHQQVSNLFWINVGLGVLTAIVTMAIAPVIAAFYHEPRLIWISLALATGFIIGSLGVQHSALLNRQMDFKALVINDLLSMGIGLAAAIVAAWYGLSYWALVIMPLVTGLVGTVGLWMVCSWRPGFPSRKSDTRSMLAFGRNLTGFSIMNYFSRNLDNVLIGRVWGAQQLGVYAKAYQLLLLPLNQINSPIAAVAVPTLSRLTDSPERYRQTYLRVLEKISMLTTPLVAFMIATSDWLVWLLLGDQWAEVGRIFSILGIAAFTQPVANTTGWIFITQNRTNHMVQWGAIGSTLSIISIIAGLPWGASGVAASYSISGLLIRTPILFWFVGRAGSVRTKDIYRTIAPSTFASLCAFVVMIAVRRYIDFPHPLIGIVIAFVINLGTTLLILAAFPAGRKALQDFKDLIPVIFKRKRKDIQK